MLHLLKRHPIPIRAYFRHCLVLTYALPKRSLEPLVPYGLAIDEFNGLGFLAVAMVQTQELRPAILPAFCGRDFFLSGYRVFVRFTGKNGRVLRGLRILRSDTDSRLMAGAGNLLTHYNYRLSEIQLSESPDKLRIAIKSGGGEADLSVVAQLSASEESLPEGSPFDSVSAARRFAGPMPYTFDYEAETHSIIRIRGIRSHWKPRLVPVAIKRITFFQQPEFRGAKPVLASAFYVGAIPYRWEKGIRESLKGTAA